MISTSPPSFLPFSYSDFPESHLSSVTSTSTRSSFPTSLLSISPTCFLSYYFDSGQSLLISAALTSLFPSFSPLPSSLFFPLLILSPHHPSAPYMYFHLLPLLPPCLCVLTSAPVHMVAAGIQPALLCRELACCTPPQCVFMWPSYSPASVSVTNNRRSPRPC